MARIGHFADVHYPGPDDTFRSDLGTLLNTKDSDIVVHGGDQIIGNEANVPHSPESDIRDYWENVVEDVSGAIDASHAIMGNHDVPYPYAERITAEYIGSDRTGTPQHITPADGVSVYLINTQGPAIVQGGDDSVAQNNCYVPYSELEWLNTKLSNSPSGEINIVIGHAPVWFSTNEEMFSYHPDAPWADRLHAYMIPDTAYDVVDNFELVRRIMESNAPVVYLSGHDFHIGAEEYTNVGGTGFYHIWQDHYGETGSSSPNRLGFLDADPSTGTVQFRTFPSGGTTETTVMDITPNW